MMLQLSILLFGLVATSINGAPIRKRIAQDTPSSTAKWEQACLAAGGALQCNPVSVAAFGTLLAAADACAQQNAADDMIDLAKTLNNDPEMIKLTQIFVQQPRNSPSSESVQYCQQAPKNPELNGLFQCQFKSTKPTTFVGGVAVGQTGTIPFGLSDPVSPPGACPASPDGPVADGAQLVDSIQDPGLGNVSAGGGSGAPPPASSSTPSPPPSGSAAPPPPADSCDDDSDEGSDDSPAPPAASAPASSNGSAAGDAPATAGGDFKLQNGKDAQALNAKFAALTANSPCSEGDQACIGTGFAQCVSGKFVTTSCGASLTCAALPLVNSPGTSITCTTSADAAARIKATGATGGITGA